MPRIFVAALLMLLAAAPLAAAAGPPSAMGARLAAAAAEQIGVTTSYDPSYRTIAFPGGDVPADRGVCSDVVVRAYRRLGIDLQRLVHDDMRRAFAAYPALWGLSRPDPSIDHRRVPNLARFFARNGAALRVSTDPADYRAGDVVTWRLPGGEAHIGIVGAASDGRTPPVIHNIGAGTQREDVLFAFTITGHYRYLPERAGDPSPPIPPS